MTSMVPVTDQWSARAGWVPLVLRLVGVGFVGYLLLTQGAFTGGPGVAAGAGVALLLCAGLMILRHRRPFGRTAVVLTVVMMVCGVLVNPAVAYTGSVFFVLGGIVLLGQPELPLRTGIVLVAAVSVVLVVTAGLAHPDDVVILSSGLGAAAVALLGLNRRQQVTRRRQEQELAARSRELAERNAELEVQTAMTRQETARAAAIEERSRIARDIHDVLAHSLGGLVVQLDAVEAELADGRTVAASARLRVSRQLAVDGLRDAKAAVTELRADPDRVPGPPVADLVAAVEAVLRGPVGVSLNARLEVVGAPRPVTSPVAGALVATVREALTNINKHAPGERAAATLIFEPAEVLVEVVNAVPADGGVPPGPLAASGAGVGLSGLRQRVQRAGGRFEAGREGDRWVVVAAGAEPDGVVSTRPTS